MSKQVKMQARPRAKDQIDDWVESRGDANSLGPREKPKRLTIDIDRELHTRLKIHCATHDLQIADLLRRLIQQEVSCTNQ